MAASKRRGSGFPSPEVPVGQEDFHSDCDSSSSVVDDDEDCVVIGSSSSSVRKPTDGSPEINPRTEVTTTKTGASSTNSPFAERKSNSGGERYSHSTKRNSYLGDRNPLPRRLEAAMGTICRGNHRSFEESAGLARNLQYRFRSRFLRRISDFHAFFEGGIGARSTSLGSGNLGSQVNLW
ncbi:hypothetical protein TSUD_242380 [Trifolium subterraneum]|uniref:Uncharacterized protein n=1 Tax=Trifolium subterraneum TaxID=3900 RepID=A0A2Z6NEU4_TRISU|nr:hypothetical protein TSUD_242380 [Trifolium subterraneum]